MGSIARGAASGVSSTFKTCVPIAAAIVIVPIVARLAIVVGVVAIAVLLVVLAWRIGRQIDAHLEAKNQARSRPGDDPRGFRMPQAHYSNRR